jgi:hypothetical protein
MARAHPSPDGAGRKTGRRGRFFAPLGLHAEMAALAESQHGVMSLAQLVGLGLSESAVHKRAAAGRLFRIHQGVYALAPRSLISREGHWMAAVLAGGAEAFLSHRSNAVLYELRSRGGRLIDITVPGRSRGHHDGLFIHRSTTLSPADVTTVDGIPCTTVARTLLDLAAVLPRRAIERAADQAEIAGTFDLAALVDQLERHPRHRGARVLAAVLDTHAIGQTATVNEFEEAFLAIVRRAGLPDPEVNVWLVLPDGEPAIRVDFLWRAQRLAVETDGRRSHGTRLAFERDRRRDQRLTVARFRPVRVTRRQVFGCPDELERTLRALL